MTLLRQLHFLRPIFIGLSTGTGRQANQRDLLTSPHNSAGPSVQLPAQHFLLLRTTGIARLLVVSWACVKSSVKLMLESSRAQA